MADRPSKLCELIDLQYPIFCTGMHWFSDPGLCCAVSEAGGVGCVAATRYDDPEGLRVAIREVRSRTDRPFSINITWLPGHYPTELIQGYWEVCIEEAVPVVETSGMSPDMFIDAAHEAGIVVIQQVGSVRHAIHAQSAGADAVMAIGFEAGGHPLLDNVTTLVLVPRVVDSVDIPVIAGGGIADGRGMAAAFALGAQGVAIGTRFLFTKESSLNAELKDRFLPKLEHETSIVQTPMGLQARILDVGLGERIKLDIENALHDMPHIVRLLNGASIEQANEAADIDEAVWCFGQSIGLVQDIPSCSELVPRIADEATRVAKSSRW